MKPIVILWLLAFPAIPLFSQAEVNAPVQYIIRRIDYHITGKTKSQALERKLDLKEGEHFSGKPELDEYTAEKNQELYNLRAFQESSSVTYRLGEAEEDGNIPVYLEVSVIDSSSFIILPEPKYDSNAGFTLSLDLREHNFLGTLSPFKFDLRWKTDEKKRTSAGFLLDAALPFRAFGYNWNFTVLNDFKYYFTGEPAYSKTALGLSMELPWSFTTFTFGFDQGFILHEENDEKDDIEDGEYHDWYLFSKLYADWEIPTPLEIGIFGKLTYTPGIYGNINYQPGGEDIGELRRGPSAGFKQELGFGRIDWKGNFREGLKAALINDNEYNFHREGWDSSLTISALGHLRVSRLFGFSGRIRYSRWFGDPYTLGGDVIRGYRDDEIRANERLSLNLEFPFRLIRFVPSEWTNNKKYHYFDFEQHWSLFADFLMAGASNKKTNSPPLRFTPEDIITTAGLEIITFPLKWRSVYLRISAGWNIREWVRTGKLPSGIHREIYLGMGHFF